MIGGVDVIIETRRLSIPTALETVARTAHRRWPDAVFVDAETGERFASFSAISFGLLQELFVFRDEASRASWEQLGLTDENADAAIHALAGPHTVTVVVNDPRERTASAVIDALRTLAQLPSAIAT